MMQTTKAAVIGTGRKPEKPGLSGWAMAYYHGHGYTLADNVEIAACADIVEENAAAFVDAFDVGQAFLDYHEMIREVKPDIVSICTWPRLHAQMAIDCMEAGVPAVHCEKPMAVTWADARRVFETAERTGCRLTFNHQRRLSRAFMEAGRLIAEGAIGTVLHAEAYTDNLYDYGVNSLDILNCLLGDPEPAWVMGQADASSTIDAFGVPLESQGLAWFAYENEVTGTIFAGGHDDGADASEPTAPYRIIGTDGYIVLNWKRNAPPVLRCFGPGGVTEPDTGEDDIHSPFAGLIDRCLAHVVDTLRNNEPCVMDYHNEYRSMQIIFGAYESARRGGRVRLPDDISDSPLLAVTGKETS
jgi:predicted dehydrogenase